jgi:competence protein ComGF
LVLETIIVIVSIVIIIIIAAAAAAMFTQRQTSIDSHLTVQASMLCFIQLYLSVPLLKM